MFYVVLSLPLVEERRRWSPAALQLSVHLAPFAKGTLLFISGCRTIMTAEQLTHSFVGSRALSLPHIDTETAQKGSGTGRQEVNPYVTSPKPPSHCSSAGVS